ncbi:MAG: ice-binding family protein [Bryobacteraceae bacterium]
MRRGLLWTLMVVMVAVPAFGGSIAAPDLGTAISFGMLGDTISNTGESKVVGYVGATTTITGFGPPVGPGIATLGAFYTAPNVPGSTVGMAFTDFETAFDTAFSDALTPHTQTVGDLTGNRTFYGNNVYQFTSTDVTSTADITLTFDAGGDSSNVFIIRIPEDLTINGPLTFDLINEAQWRNIYWIVGRTASITAVTVPQTFEGSILAGTSFTIAANNGGSGVLGGTIDGCVFVETANTLGGKTYINGCNAAAAPIPEPGSSGLVALGCLLGALRLRKFRFVRRTR